MKKFYTSFLGLLLAGFVTLAGASQVAAQQSEISSEKVRKELVTLPYYGIFDNLAYQIEGGTVTLSGEVVRPTTRKDAERRVAKLAGVRQVVNNIEVLPFSRFDDEIRVRIYRQLSDRGGLYRYTLGANPSLHIIVKNGNVKLVGFVTNEGDSNLANILANGVPGVFSVTNQLQVENSRRQ